MLSEQKEPQLKAPNQNIGGYERSTRAQNILECIKIIASIGTFIAAIVACIQYVDSFQELRTERSLKFVNSWKSENISDSYSLTRLFVQDMIDRDGYPDPSLTKEQMSRALSNLGARWTAELIRGDNDRVLREGVQPKELIKHIDTVVLFFEEMEVCIESELCDDEVLLKFFGGRVQTFWVYFKGYARLRRSTYYPQFGSKVDSLELRRLKGTGK